MNVSLEHHTHMETFEKQQFELPTILTLIPQRISHISILKPVLNVLVFFLHFFFLLCLYHHNDLWVSEFGLSSRSVHKIRLRLTLYLIIMFTFYVYIYIYTTCHSVVWLFCIPIESKMYFETKCNLTKVHTKYRFCIYMELYTLLTFWEQQQRIDYFILIVAIVGVYCLLFIVSVTFNSDFKLIFVGGNFSRYYQNKMILLLIIMGYTDWLTDWLNDSIFLADFSCNTMSHIAYCAPHSFCLNQVVWLWFTTVVVSDCLTYSIQPDNGLLK